ncbi:O-antigen ligase family protein [Pelotomaculum isophthalicicum JI]|uniref:O-antigen ligase family protein n=1 Tax=Pelotomaculum isophthalicicum JI TaxID=947010 RepID=A0A9X4GZ67_9FIRM|nr:O-antigen ligase family protein [Pelotomaculum isophthalicicum]MDF9408420.1 O-antigen ligase family protein [Pelotomaculum isophthalicicum JI]
MKISRYGKIFKYVLSISALGLVALAPFFRGLMFEREMSIHHCLVALISVLALIPLIFCSDGPSDGRERLPVRRMVKSPYFLALALLTVLYGLSSFQAVNSRESLFIWLRHVDYLLSFIIVYLAVGMWSKDKQQSTFMRWSLTVFAVAGTLVAAGGILTCQGIVSIDSGVAFGRLRSTFQYPNAMAAYLMATVLMAIHLAARNPRPLKAGVFAGMGFLIFLAILGSQSRGVWVMLPLILALFFFGQTARKRFILLTAVIFGLAISLSSLTVAPQAQQLQPNWRASLCTLAGFSVAGIIWGGFVKSWLSLLKVYRARKKIIILGIICAILVVFAGTVLVRNHWDGAHEKGISGSPLLSRLMRVNTSENNFQSRMVYYTDALKMVKDRPLLGWGGGGWLSGYPAYQSYNYISTTVHNHFLQVWVEAGTLAMIVFIIPFLVLTRGLWRLYHTRKIRQLSPETWTIGVAALALGMHSAIDFDLSFSSIALLLWGLLALFACQEMVLGFDRVSQDSFGSKRAGAVKFNVLLAIFLSLASISLAAGTITLRAGEAKAKACVLAIQKGDREAAIENIQAASRLDRWSAQHPIIQAQLLMSGIEDNPDPLAKNYLANESLNLVQRALKLDSYNSENHFMLARLYLANGNLEDTLAEAERAKVLQPWLIRTYEEYNSIYENVAVQQLLRGQKEEAGDTLRRVLAATQEAVSKKETLPTRLNSLWDKRSDLTLTPALALTAGQSALLLEDYNQAREFLNIACQAEDQKTKDVAQLWLGVAMRKGGVNEIYKY